MVSSGTKIGEPRPFQARCRGFEPHHPLFPRKDVSSNLALSLEQLLLSILDEKSRRRFLLKEKSNEELEISLQFPDLRVGKADHSMIGLIFMIAQIHADCTASRYIQRFCFPPDCGYS